MTKITKVLVVDQNFIEEFLVMDKGAAFALFAHETLNDKKITSSQFSGVYEVFMNEERAPCAYLYKDADSIKGVEVYITAAGLFNNQKEAMISIAEKIASKEIKRGFSLTPKQIGFTEIDSDALNLCRHAYLMKTDNEKDHEKLYDYMIKALGYFLEATATNSTQLIPLDPWTKRRAAIEAELGISLKE